MPTIIKKSEKSNTDFYGRDIQTSNHPVLNLMPSEELTYKLDNVLSLTDDHRIIIYNNLIQIKTNRPNPSNPGNCKSISKSIKTFSVNSRRNLSKHLCKIRFDQYKERWFVTLTFHNKFPSIQKEFKQIIDRFNKRLSRKNLLMSYIWKLEYQKRGAPHLHYLLLFPGRLSYKNRTEIAGMVKRAWIECVADDSELFKQLSVDIRQVSNNNKTVNYILKYIGKLDESVVNHSLGRFWAISRNLNEDPLRIVKVDERFYENFRSILLHYIKEKYTIGNDEYDRIALNNSFELQLNSEDSLELIKELAKRENMTYVVAQLQNSPP